jgi:hypothetical protein
MPSQNWSSIAASIVVGLLIVGALFYTFSQTSSRVSSLSSQNAGLFAENANLQGQVSSLGQQVSTLEQRTLEVVTMTNTVIELEPTTLVTTATETYTSTVYPIPDNVTVYIVASGQAENYAVNAGSYSASGSLGSPQTLLVSPVYQGETINISITLSCPGSTGPSGYASLYVNNALVSHTNVVCGGTTTGQISYVL